MYPISSYMIWIKAALTAAGRVGYAPTERDSQSERELESVEIDAG